MAELPKGFSLEPPKQPQQAATDLPAGFSLEPPKQPAQGKNTYDTFIAPAVKAVGDAGSYVYDSVVGKQDPKFANTPTIESLGVLPLSELSRVKLTGINDAGYTNIIKRMLGPRLVGETKDANGYTVLAIRGEDGKVYQGYVNKPGLDSEDVDRGISGAIPYMIGGGAMARFQGAAPLALRMIGQGGAAGGVSLGQDVAAQGAGSGQPLDRVKAIASVAAGAGGEAIAAFVAPLIRRMMGNRALIGPDGKLTPRGQKLVEKEGLDPALVDDEIAAEIARRSATAANEPEVIRQVTADRYGIPSTKGQRTNDPQQVLIEKDIRTGTFGQAAKERLGDIDRQQREAVGRFANQDFARALNPERGGAQSPAALGTGVKEGYDTAAGAAKRFEQEAWSKVPNIEATVAAKRLMPDSIKRALGDRRIVPQNQPTAAAMINELRSFMANKAPETEFSEFLGQQSVTYVNEMRTILMGQLRSASSQNGDRELAGRIYRGFNDWVQEAASRKLLKGDVAAATALREAIGATKEARSTMTATLAAGTQKTPATRILERIKNAESGEDVLNALIGRGGPAGKPAAGTVEGLRAYKNALDKFAGQQGKPAWDDVRLAYWTRLTTNGQGDLHPFGVMRKNIRTALRQQESVMQTLFSLKERLEMARFADALKAITPKDPNPSGSGTAVARLFPQLAKEAAYTQSKRATFSQNNVIMARIWRALGSWVKTFEKPSGRVEANRAVSQNLTQRRTPGGGGYAAGAVGSVAPFQEQEGVGRFAQPNAMLRRR